MRALLTFRRAVTLGGAGAFLIFGVIYLAEALYYA
jgi:hypothetical protein